jgi:hypothetical protein
VFGWRGAAGLGMSGRHRRLPVVHRSAAGPSTLPSGPGTRDGARQFIRPWLFLLNRGGEGPAPAGQFAGDGDVGDGLAFVPGFELLPLVVEPVVIDEAGRRWGPLASQWSKMLTSCPARPCCPASTGGPVPGRPVADAGCLPASTEPQPPAVGPTGGRGPSGGAAGRTALASPAPG